MKKYFSCYLCFLLVFFSLTARAMEQTTEEGDVLTLQTPHKIVENVLPWVSYEVSAEKVISILASQDREDVCNQFMKIDRAKSIALFKAFIEQDQVGEWFKLDALILFAQHAAGEEKDYIISQVQSLNYEEKDMDNVEGDLARLYYYLNNPELCGFYYQQMVQKMLVENSESDVKLLADLNIERPEDLLDYDPFKFFRILLAKKD